MTSRDLRDRIRDLVEPTVQRLGFDVVAVEWVVGQGRPTLRLSIEGPQGVGADDCALVSVRLGPVLDETDPVGGPYRLEVSSPGIERPVQRLADFARFVGYRVRIRMEEGLPRRRYTGIIAGVEDDQVRLEVDGAVHALPFESIDVAHLDLDLEQFMALAPAPDAAVARPDVFEPAPEEGA